jgi:hypothetical protein
VRDSFGEDVAAMVATLTEDDGIDHYFPRKRALRGKIAAAGSPVVDVALADKIATLRHTLITGTRLTKRKLAHYRATLQLALAAGEDSCHRSRRAPAALRDSRWSSRGSARPSNSATFA